MQAYALSDAARLSRTEIPEGKIPLILDTDTYNEIDDQFAILYAMLSPDRIDLRALYAAGYHNDRSESFGDGMEKSYGEILRICGMMGKDPANFAYRGCARPLTSREEYEPGDAVEDLIRRARSQPEDQPLFVACIGACTNLASALIKAPDIAGRIVAVVLLGNSYDWHSPREFNLGGDCIAGGVLMDSGVPLIQVPAFGVTGFLLTSVPELEACIGGKNALCDYLVENVKEYESDHFAWSKAIWDVGAIGLLANPQWAVTKIVPAPYISDDGLYTFLPGRSLIRCVCELDRDGIFRDMFGKLIAHGK